MRVLLSAGCMAALAASQPAVADYVKLWPCDAATAPVFQSWDLPNASSPWPSLAGEIVVRGSETSNPVVVWSIEATPHVGANVHLWGTGRGNNPEEAYAFDAATGLIHTTNFSGWCVRSQDGIAGLPLQVAVCDTTDASQAFAYDPVRGVFTAVIDRTLCVDAGTPLPNCSVPPQSGYTFCDVAAGPDARAADLVSRLSVHELATLVSFSNSGVPRFGLPKVSYNEALHGVVYGCGPTYFNATTGFNSTGCPTSFPHALALGAAFNRSLWHAVASTISDEGRALHNTNGYALFTWAPDVNPFRDPRWGRGQEVTGEDPFLMSEYITQYARGFAEGEDARYIKLVSTAKHFVGYDLESWGDVNRQNFTAVIGARDLVQYYLPAFEAAVSKAGVHSIMCSYNALTVPEMGVAGVPSCADGALNNGYLRDQLGWDGYIVSDCGAVINIYATHHYASSLLEAVSDAMNGGCDVECNYDTQTYAALLPVAVAQGSVTLATLQAAVTRLMRVYFWLGMADGVNATVYGSYGPEHVDTAAARALALEGALQGAVLLRNEPYEGGAPLLPLRKGLASLAAIGPHANATKAMLSIYAGDNALVYGNSPLAALTRRLQPLGATVTYAAGCADVACADTTGFAAAAAVAAAADVAVVFVGLDNTQEDEGRDRYNLTLPGNQEALVQAVVAAGKPVVVALVHGGVLDVTWTAANVAAILDLHYPGELGGEAAAALLLGDASPSGRTTTTWYPQAFVEARPMTDMALSSREGITYLYYNGSGPSGPPLWPFGFGLSYTTFTYAWADGGDGAEPLELDARALAAGTAPPPVAVTITNTGAVTSDVSALAFWSSGAPGQPIAALFDFARVAALAPGANATVFFTLPPAAVAAVAADGSRAVHACGPGACFLRVGSVPRAGGAGVRGGTADGSFIEREVRVSSAGGRSSWPLLLQPAAARSR